MSHAIDFTELKQRVTIERAAEMLGIKLTKSGAQRRGTCPICKAGGDRAFVLTPAKGLYYCFGTCSKGGDAITMAANVRNCSLREAAEFLDGKAAQGRLLSYGAKSEYWRAPSIKLRVLSLPHDLRWGSSQRGRGCAKTRLCARTCRARSSSRRRG